MAPTDGRGDELKKKKKDRDQFFKTKKEKSWRKSNEKSELRAIREEKLLKELEQVAEPEPSAVEDHQAPQDQFLGGQSRFYSLSIALPGSILNNAQSPELRVYLAGQIARAASISCVDEIVIFDENARMQKSQIESYYEGNWQAEKPIRDDNVECNFHAARILEYLECPQYLRKALFPLQKSLSCAGVLNPLDCPHHLRATDFSIPYREGIILDKPVKKGRGPFCDVGLDRELQLESELALPPLTRVTVHLTKVDPGAKRYRGKVVSPSSVRQSAGLYWGYNVRIAQSLSDAMTGHPQYDMVIGTSERGIPVEQLELPSQGPCRLLIVFGGLKGLEAAVDADESLAASDPKDVFENYVSIASGQGSRTIRTEEAILMTLGILKSRLDFPIDA